MSQESQFDEEKEIEEALDSWQEHYENGQDLTARELRPGWPERLLKLVDARIACRRVGLQHAARGEDSTFYELLATLDNQCGPKSNLGFMVGDRVKGTDFILEDLLGSGGFGEVWKATSRYLPNQFVALKFCLRSEDAASLKNEAALLNRIQKECCDEGFVEILATHIDHSPPFVVYKYIGGGNEDEGGNLYDYLDNRFRTKGPYSFIEAAQIMLEILRPMVVAHTRKPPIAHRDLKPHNILVARSDCFPPKLKIADFGLGGLSIRSSILASKRGMNVGKHIAGGTPVYASQEQMEDETRRPNTSDDVHALGVIWYELLIGKLLRGRPSGTGWRETLAEGLTEEQIAFLQSCFDDEAHRPRDAVAMAEMIEKFLPSIEENIREDLDEIWRLRKAGEDWRGYIRTVAPKRTAVWRQAARQGDSHAHWLIGLCREMQINVDGQRNYASPDNYREAANCFLVAAQGQNADAEYSLACYCRLGIGGVKKDEQEELRWLTKAAEHGQPDALYELGLRRMESEDELTNIVGVNWLFRAARAGHAEAQFFCAKANLGYLSVGKTGMTRRYFKAQCQSELNVFGVSLDKPSGEQCVGWLRKLGARGHAEAQFLLGKYCEDRSKDVDEAIKWFRKAAARGHLEAQFCLSQCYAVKRRNLIVDTAKRLNVDEEALQTSDSTNVDQLCELSDRLNRDEPMILALENESLKWLMLAAKRGLADAQFALVEACDPGRQSGVSILHLTCFSREETLEWLCRAISQGHDKAVWYLVYPMESKSSTIYGVFSMLSMHPRIVEALEKIAEKGNVHAAWYLANAYSWGDMGIRDSVKARKWLQLTASLGLDYQVAVEAVKIVLDGSHAVPHEEMFRPEELFSWSTSGTWWWSEFWVDAEGKAMAESYFRYAEKLCNEGPGRTLRDEAWAAWWYQAAAMQGHPEAKQRLVHMQFPPTWAIMNMFRPVDQQPSSPKTP